MNAKQIIAAIAVFAATGSAFADNRNFVEHTNLPSTRTRAEVRAEIEQARAEERIAGNSEFVEHVHVASTRNREEVRGEALQATRNHVGTSLYLGG